MSHVWGDEDPLHVQDEPNCPTCGNPMSRHWLSRFNWECEDCESQQEEEDKEEDK